MKHYHVTKDGKKIALEDLTDSHLENIIKWIERKAKVGLTTIYGGGFDHYDMWCDEDTYYGKEALDILDYNLYVEELKRRHE